MDNFLTPSHKQQFENEIKRSRFIASLGNVENKQAAKQFIASLRVEFHDASHHCWAMVAGRPDDIHQHDQSDDGEPKGTAGKPMLNVLQHSGFGNIVVVVSRYFGGIKLGTGGLIRAYSQSVSKALTKVETRRAFITEKQRVEVPWALLASLEHWLKNTNITIDHKEFLDCVVLTLSVPSSELEDLTRYLSELGSGRIVIEKTD